MQASPDWSADLLPMAGDDLDLNNDQLDISFIAIGFKVGLRLFVVSLKDTCALPVLQL
jgi:hypothetical protein